MPRSILSELKQYIQDALPGGKLNRELTLDVNESPVPRGVAVLRAVTGTAPDELGISVMNPRAKEIRDAAEPAYALGTALGIVPALSMLKEATAPARLLGGYSGAIPMREFERNLSRVKVPKGQRVLFHATDIPWEGKVPKPNTWFSDVPPSPDNPFGQTVRAYVIPSNTPISAPLTRGKNFYDDLAALKEPVAAVDEGNGLVSYVVREPSVLQRLKLQRDFSRPLNREIGAVGPVDARSGSFGKGWWLNPRNDRVSAMKPGDLGPNGDHDGWIGVVKNAIELGVDPKDAKAFQRGSFGFYLPRRMSKNFDEDVLYRGRAHYNPMQGDSDPEADELFRRLYGYDPIDAATSMPDSMRDLVRIRKWQTGDFTYNPTGDIDDLLIQKMSKTVDNIPEIWGSKKVSIYGDELPGHRAQFTPEDFSRLRSLRDLKRFNNPDLKARGGLAQLKECSCGN